MQREKEGENITINNADRRGGGKHGGYQFNCSYKM